MPTEPSEIPADHEHDDAALTDAPAEITPEAPSNIPATGFHFTPETDEESEAPPVLAPELVESIAQLQLKRRREKSTRRIVIAAIICLLPVIGPIVYLTIVGKLRHPVDIPSQVAVSSTPIPPVDNSLQHSILNPNFSVPSGPPATPRPDDPVANDFKHYFNVELVTVTPLELKMMQDFALATGKNFKSVAESDRIMREKVVPDCRAYVAKIVSIHPKTPEITDAHNYLRNAAQARLSGYEKIAQLTGTKTDQALQQGIRQDGVVERTNITQYHDTLSSVASAHGFKEGQLVPVSK